jgi:hypothetical protein
VKGGGGWLGGFDRSLRALMLSPFVSQKLRGLVSKETSADLQVGPRQGVQPFPLPCNDLYVISSGVGAEFAGYGCLWVGGVDVRGVDVFVGFAAQRADA